MVSKIDALLEALHEIILSSIFKIGVFTPALLNACLVGFGVWQFTSGLWGSTAGVLSGVIAAAAIEVVGISAGWNMDLLKARSYLLPVLYVFGSWVVIWFGLRAGLLVDVIGTVSPIFAVSLPTVIATKKAREDAKDEMRAERDHALALAKQTQEHELALAVEQTKQARANERAAKGGGAGKLSQAERLEYLKPIYRAGDFSPTQAAQELGVSRQTIYTDIDLLQRQNGVKNGVKFE